LRASPLAVGAAALVLVAATLAAAAQPASASRKLKIGIYDEAQTLYSPTKKSFVLYHDLRAQFVRVNLYWGGPHGVARFPPRHPANPRDRAYRWGLYDRAVRKAAVRGIKIVFSIYGTPTWANLGKGMNRAPRQFSELQAFAHAAARRYSGTYRAGGRRLPAVRHWLAWNEPNNPVFLKPQYRRVKKHWVIQSAVTYASICNAIYRGIHGAGIRGERVACGVTAPRGNNDPRSSRPSIAPLAFLRAAHHAGLRTFDVWAHHPYYTGPSDRPNRVPTVVGSPQRAAITLGNIKKLTSLLTRYYGRKHIWITEYGFQTNPPDHFFGVSWTLQARYLTQAYRIARKNPRIDMMLWFLMRDEANLGGWQSGLMTVKGKKKPAYAAFQRMAKELRKR
jgi:hypothetical protein